MAWRKKPRHDLPTLSKAPKSGNAAQVKPMVNAIGERMSENAQETLDNRSRDTGTNSL